jgi:hypothetical protein
MSCNTIKKFISLALLGTMSVQVGCVSLSNMALGPVGIPIPISPYLQDNEELQFHVHERYARVPIMGPITDAYHAAIDPPSDDEVMHALERARPVRGGIPFLNEKQRNRVRIVKEKIADYVDEPRFVPLIGWPVPYSLEDNECVEVIYIDHNHFHMCGDPDTGASSPY